MKKLSAREPTKAIRSVPSSWDLYIGKRFVGYVSKMYIGAKPFGAFVSNDHELEFDLGRFATRSEAERVIAARVREEH
jgi:hypothetical protein